MKCEQLNERLMIMLILKLEKRLVSIAPVAPQNREALINLNYKRAFPFLLQLIHCHFLIYILSAVYTMLYTMRSSVTTLMARQKTDIAHRAPIRKRNVRNKTKRKQRNGEDWKAKRASPLKKKEIKKESNKKEGKNVVRDSRCIVEKEKRNWNFVRALYIKKITDSQMQSSSIQVYSISIQSFSWRNACIVATWL